MLAVLIGFCLWSLSLHLHAATDTLPEPLTLRAVIQRLDNSEHPALLQARASQLLAQAEAQQIEARYSTQAEINARAQWINPSSLSFDPSRQDHRVSLKLSKRLYDFGVTGERERASQSLLQASALDASFAQRLHQIDVTRKYLDVLLADLRFAWANEAMSMAYVTLDKVRERHALKQVDDISLLQEEARYQQSLAARNAAQLNQRVSRAALAEAMNRPGELPAELTPPALPALLSPLPDPEELAQQALQSAPQLLAQQQRVQAAQASLQAASNQWRPSLSADADYTEYRREIPSRENWRAGVTLRIPLIESGIDKADVAVARAEWLAQSAELTLLQSQLREEVYRYWQSINQLQASSRALAAEQQYASRALDKSRGEYELERRTDFGDAQVRVSEIRYRKAKNDYQLQIEKMQLALITGQNPVDLLFAEAPAAGSKSHE